jgi:anthranilate synthase component 1
MSALADAWPERVRYDEGTPEVPFRSGLMGWLSYDLKDHLERYPARARRESSLPDASLGFHDVVFAWDRRSDAGWVVSTGLPERDPGLRSIRADARLHAQLERLSSTPPPEAAPDRRSPLVSNFTREEYQRVVERALEHIAAGDIYQVVLSQRFEAEVAADPFTVYRALRHVNPSPYMYFIRMGGVSVVGSSPEMLVRVEGSRVETHPIAGTRPRGRTDEEDMRMAEELKRNEKERAEHVMLVDLGRNDIGRVCEYGSVRVPQFMGLERFSHVMHLTSIVEGRLADDRDRLDALVSCFPAGTVSGAPKVRAMEIIKQLEPSGRGLYAGAVGYLDFAGNLDFCIAIRTVIMSKGRAYVQAGAWIVMDSNPTAEYEETRDKAKALLRALELAQAGL